MSDHATPYFHNDVGARLVEVGAREFMCMGAKPPFDHPHIYLDMGGDDEIVCGYCSTLFKHNASLKATQAIPADCVWHGDEDARREPVGADRGQVV